MLVRSLTLKNFKNHRDLVWADIDPRCNLILGKNGQGKSNIHIALLFLMSDLYGTEGSYKKKELLSVAGCNPRKPVLLRRSCQQRSPLIIRQEPCLPLTVTQSGSRS